MTMLEEVQREIQRLRPEELQGLRDQLREQRKERMRAVLRELASNPMTPEEAAVFDAATERQPWRSNPVDFDQ